MSHQHHSITEQAEAVAAAMYDYLHSDYHTTADFAQPLTYDTRSNDGPHCFMACMHPRTEWITDFGIKVTRSPVDVLKVVTRPDGLFDHFELVCTMPSFQLAHTYVEIVCDAILQTYVSERDGEGLPRLLGWVYRSDPYKSP